MKTNIYPKIASVYPIENFKLKVVFDNGSCKIYNCAELLKEKTFHPLVDPVLFHAVKVDPGGCGISWNDNLDLSEAELWINGYSEESGI